MSKYLVIVFLFAIRRSLEAGSFVDFCSTKYDCTSDTGPHTHTICKLPNKCLRGPNCTQYVNMSLTENEKEALLKKHNELRNQQALGKGPRSIENKVFPKAANMMEMVWDNFLEFEAQCWANQCPTGHASCIKTYGGVARAGQILAWSLKNEILNMIEEFYNESAKTPINIIDKFDVKYLGKRIGYFTQLVYANSTQLGCARTRYYFEKNETYFLVCNYGEGLNWANSRVYDEGEPCTKCPEGSKCHATYEGLCSTQPSQSEIPNICEDSDKDCEQITQTEQEKVHNSEESSSTETPESKINTEAGSSTNKEEDDKKEDDKKEDDKKEDDEKKDYRKEDIDDDSSNDAVTGEPKGFYTKQIMLLEEHGSSGNDGSAEEAEQDNRTKKGSSGKKKRKCIIERRIIIINQNAGMT